MYYLVLQDVFASSHCSFSGEFISSSGGFTVTRCCRGRGSGSREKIGRGPVNGTVCRRKGQPLVPQSLLDQLEQFLPACFYGHSSISEASESLDSLPALQGKRGWRTGSSSQEVDAIRPVPSPCFFEQLDQCPHQASNVRWRDGLFVDEDYTTVLSPFFCPRLEQRGNGPTVVGNQRQPFGGSFQQASGIFLAQEVATLPFRHPMHDQRTVATSETILYFGRDMFIQKKLEHLSFSPVWWKRIRSPGAACVSASGNRLTRFRTWPPRSLPETPPRS